MESKIVGRMKRKRVGGWKVKRLEDGKGKGWRMESKRVVGWKVKGLADGK